MNMEALEPENKKAFENRMKYLKGARFFKWTVYESIISDLSDIDFLRLNLGIYTDVYINEIESNFEKISSEIKSELQKSEYSKIDNEAIKILEAKAKKLLSAEVEKLNSSVLNGVDNKQKLEFEDILNEKLRDKLNDKEVKKLKEILSNKFKKDISKHYFDGVKEPFNFLIIYLLDKELIRFKPKKMKDTIRFLREFLIGEYTNEVEAMKKEIHNDYQNFDKLLKTYKDNKGKQGFDDYFMPYTNYKEVIKPLIEEFENEESMFILQIELA